MSVPSVCLGSEKLQKRHTISVALCTYNGAQFLREQLASIAAQNLPPDDVVICDDASRDDSVAVARRFADLAPFPVTIRRNPRNLGSRDNFSQCIAACTGQIIVLSDQDDIWLPHKLERLASALAQASDASFAFSDALMIDEHEQPLPFSLWETLRLTSAERRLFASRRGFEALLRRQIVTGATLAFRADYRDILLPIPEGWVHDAWIALVLSAVAWGIPVNEPLIRYRQHDGQQIGEPRRSIYQQYLRVRGKPTADFQRAAHAIRAARDRLRERAPRAEQAIHALDRKLLHAERRVRIHSHRALRGPLVLRELMSGSYAKYSLGWKALAQDLFL
jgi:glycosyltransferase involved in cell wall biosynthesis